MTSQATPWPHHVAPMPLRVRLLHSFGQARDAAVDLGVDGMALVDLLHALGEPAHDAELALPGACHLRWNAAEDAWQWCDEGVALVCTLNGRRLRPGVLRSLVPGDILEVGLLRLAIERGEVWPAAVVPEAWAPMAPQAREAPIDDSAFDLRDLAGTGQPGRRDFDSMHAADDAFGLIGLDRRQAGRPDEVLASLLQHVQPDAAPASEDTTPLPAPVAPVGGQPSLLDRLHEEFVRVVRDPSQLAGQAVDSPVADPAGGTPVPSFDELRREARQFASLRDILEPRAEFDAFLEQFACPGQDALTDLGGREDVLRLFVPAASLRVHTAALPTLTRREHHAFSPDSPAAFDRATAAQASREPLPPEGGRE
ncbi:TagK domain-containing protein [Pseudacidovorax intermedius]|uniref:TagK domain-containing protein n=1 Tax=Pseudacidovorax intermedius TaxID=433924 RepID=UPI000733DBE3|nr:TagK domain-containing protein [Pseudacidovorax intermedius]